jgi:hypothetical protein
LISLVFIFGRRQLPIDPVRGDNLALATGHCGVSLLQVPARTVSFVRMPTQLDISTLVLHLKKEIELRLNLSISHHTQITPINYINDNDAKRAQTIITKIYQI